ncbi:MAG: hypothetical protein JWM34_2861 [Ilumatobacteraceae bacterium]|nr:hypothetical protein [Ilumatobacteraceae bacterium]
MSPTTVSSRSGRSPRAALRAAVAGITTLALAAVITASAGGTASADTPPPPFEPDPGSIGGLVFYNAAGQVITSGSTTDAPFAAYVQATGPGRAGDTKATLFGYLPKNGVATGSWAGEAMTASTAFPNAGAPAPVSTTSTPVVSVVASDETLAGLAGDFPNNASDAYQGLYQLRLKTSGPNQTANGRYSEADILITGTTWTVAYSSPSAYEYAAVQPARLLETRAGGSTIDGQFNNTGFVPGGTETQLTVAGRGGVPSDASAAALNVTVTEPAADGFLTVYPCGADRPTASNVNYAKGQTIPNAVMTKLGTGGKVCLFNSQPTHLVVDVNGFFSSGTDYASLVPARVLDTRANQSTIDGQFNNTGFVPANTVTELPIAGRAGVPANAATAVLNVTVTEPAADGFVTVYPCGSDRPTASSVNYSTGQTIANAVLTKLGTGGKVCIFNSQSMHLVVDVNGYYAPAAAYVPLVPGRLLDTRAGHSTIDGQFNNTGFVAFGTVTELTVAGRAGVPTAATAAVLNVTVTEPAADGFVTVYPCGSDRPTASNLNFATGQTVANAVVSKLGTGGKVCIFNSQATHLVADVTGFYP